MPSLIGEPRYGPDYKHFDWVNPDAPKGGVVRFSVEGTFDPLNPYSIKGVTATGVGMIYDSLDGWQSGRGIDRIRPRCRVGIVPAGFFVGDVRAARPRRVFMTASRSRSTT